MSASRLPKIFFPNSFGHVAENTYLCTQIPKGSRRNTKVGYHSKNAKVLARGSTTLKQE